jgi:proteasome lid subunit RPN8/RPN11
VLLDGVLAHARRELPNECCGLLAGRVVGGAGVATMWIAVGNDAASPTEFVTNPRDMLSAFRAMRAAGKELLAIYHSHPASEPVPSRRDVERNTYGETVVHLIVGLAGPEPVVRGWWLGTGPAREAELAFAPPEG